MHFYLSDFTYIRANHKTTAGKMSIDSAIFQQIAENNWEPIVFAGMDGIVRYANPAAHSLYGYEPDELVGKNVDIFNAQVSHDTVEIVSDIISKGGWSGEIVQKKKNGETFTALLTVSLIFSEDGQPIGFASNSKDISQRVAEQELVQSALDERDLLLQEIHHRLKNNLAIISSILELQASKSSDLMFIHAIRDSQRRIKTTALIHEALYENNSLRDIEMSTYFVDLIRNVIDSYSEDLSQIVVNTNFEKFSLDIVQAIPVALILNELMTNAFKHAFPEDRQGDVTLSLQEKEDGKIHFEYIDNGMGLPEALIPETSDTTGMIVIHSLVDQIDGEINFTDNNHEGTKVTLTFEKL